jgi:exopolyphosphatase/pppGpp-phosphohydrolase
MNRAAIDLGSNMAQLLIILNDGRELNFCELTALGDATFKTENLKSEAIDRTFSVLLNYKMVLESHGVQAKDVFVFATEACRRAKNRHLLFDKIIDLGYKVELLTEIKEAYFSSLGAMSSVGDQRESVVVDIGGASTECGLLETDLSKLHTFISLKIGTLNFSEWFRDDVLKDKMANFFFEHQGALAFAKGKNVVCARGAMSTIFNMVKENFSEEEYDFNGQCIDCKDLLKGINSLLTFESKVLIKKFPYVAIRSETLMGALHLAKYILEVIQPPQVTVSSRGLAYGSLIQP